MRTTPAVALFPAIALSCLLPSAALGAWPHSPFINLPVCTATGAQNGPTMVSDGAGGAIVTWSDFRSGTAYDIYAQHLLASGVVDPAWPANGTALCTAVNNQDLPTIVSDGAGGAIVTWYDFRSGNADIYAQHVLASGVVDPAWTARNGNANGTALCTAVNSQFTPAIVSDGAGGAIVAWQDGRNAAVWDIYAQHVLANGAVDPAWTALNGNANGTPLCTATNNQLNLAIASDGAGGAIVAWQDFRNGANYDIYAQHVLAGGAVDAAWTSLNGNANGTALCTAASDQAAAAIVADGAGGAIVTWEDFRSGTNYDVYAQHVLASGATSWVANGTALSTAAGDQALPAISTDGAGGAIVAWEDARSGSFDIYAQHVQANGVVDPAWTALNGNANGTALCTAASNQASPTIAADGTGGATIAWYDLRGGTNYDIYAQHVLAGGAVDPAWTALNGNANGTALSTAAADQTFPAILADGAGGAIVAWDEFRNGAEDIYAQRVARFGYLGTPEAEIAEVKDVPNDQGGRVKLAWNASYLDLNSDPNLAAYDILRSVPPNLALARVRAGARLVSVMDARAAAGADRLLVTHANAQTFYWEYLTSVNALHYVSGYSYLAPTAGDSTGFGNPATAFMVVARNAGGTMFWPSRADSGYSVDNLPPAAPAPLAGAYLAGATHLHWGANTEADLAGYRLYRGSSAGFVPGPGNLIATPPDTGYADPGAAGSYYKLSAVDTHGNESPFTLLAPAGTLDAGGALPRELALARPQPNPAAGATLLRYALPRQARVELAIYDATGRRVRALLAGVEPAGEHARAWDLRDDAGHTVGAGLYFARLEAEGRSLSQRMIKLR